MAKNCVKYGYLSIQNLSQIIKCNKTIKNIKLKNISQLLANLII